MDKKYVIAMNVGGIANRLKCLISLWAFADKTKRKVLLYWPLNHTCGAEFRDLFENNFDEISKNELYQIKKSEFDYYGDEDPKLRESTKKYVISGNSMWSFHESLLKEGKDPIDLRFENINPILKKEVLSYLKKIRPVKKVRDAVTKFEKQYKMRGFVGVHIRRGDFADRKTSPGKVSSDEKFFEKMREILKRDPKTKFFLCTDSRETEEKVKENFPGKIIKFPKTSFVRTDVKATQGGLTDLILLSKTKHIIGTFRSTFSEIAWWIGGCHAKFEIIVDSEKLKEYNKNVEANRKSFAKKIKKIIAILVGKAPKFRLPILKYLKIS